MGRLAHLSFVVEALKACICFSGVTSIQFTIHHLFWKWSINLYVNIYINLFVAPNQPTIVTLEPDVGKKKHQIEIYTNLKFWLYTCVYGLIT